VNPPLCPIVLSLLAAAPRQAHEVARALGGDYPAALETLRRLERARLVQRRPGAPYRITRRGAGELALQRRLWTRVAVAR
jgi:Mn-dependent DtxR family transcriptional regulator